MLVLPEQDASPLADAILLPCWESKQIAASASSANEYVGAGLYLSYDSRLIPIAGI